MPDLADGETFEMKGSGAKPYVLKNTGGVYSCTCPAWRNQSVAIERRTCKHLKKLRGEAAEAARCAEGPADAPVAVAAGPATGAEPLAPAAEVPAAPVLLAESWDNAADLAGWWMSEKLDGVRGYWDGSRFLSRAGNIFKAPDWFAAGLPKVPLDGELWMDRRKFSETSGIVRRQDRSDHWKQIRFLIFDAPAHPGPFEDRLAFVTEVVTKEAPPHARALEHVRCEGVTHLRAELARVEGLGGEGLMLRQPGSPYEVGRSATLLKVKNFLDTEAVVIGHVPGAGKHKGRLGALEVRLPGGVECRVGTGFSDAQRSAPPALGSTIVLRYQELSKDGVPRFPSFVAVVAGPKPPAASS
jgi:DNA ligase-1